MPVLVWGGRLSRTALTWKGSPFGVAVPLAMMAAQLALGVPADEGTLEVRLKTHLTSYSTKAGTPFECVVIRPLEADGRVVIPRGAIVHGHVAQARGVGLGLRHERARLDLAFDSVEVPGAGQFPIEGRLASIDNAREQVTPRGVIKGVIAAQQPTQLVFGVWHSPSMSLIPRSLMGFTGLSHQISKALSLGPAGAGVLLALRCAIFKFPEPEIHLPPGADLRLLVKTKDVSSAEEPQGPGEPSSELSDWLQKEPFSLDHRDGRQAADIVNVAFLGSREQLVNAFVVAGWSEADPATRATRKQAYYAFNAMRAYATAPVSILFYRGVLPGLVFEKSLNTVTKRHHIRVWYAGVVDGKELWLGAATHDVGLAFNARSFRVTHRIDLGIDDERDKVATDLDFAGCAEQQMRVDRSQAVAPTVVPTSAKAITTDGAILVLPLRECTATNEFAGTPAPRPPGNRASRLVRRLILEARNHLLRENAYYWTFQLLKQKQASQGTGLAGSTHN